LPVGTKATTLGWVKSAIQATLALGSIGFSGKAILQNVLGFAAGVGSSRILSLLPSRNIGPGGTAPFGFQAREQALTKDQGNLVWNALKLAKTALERPACRDYVGEGAYQALRRLWDNRRITYFHGTAFDHQSRGDDVAGVRRDFLLRPWLVLSFNYFDDSFILKEARHYGLSLEQQRAEILLHEARHVLCGGCKYAEDHESGQWEKDISRLCFK
jgi:hypothetical protein